jgi:hypothetical protein
MNDPSSSNQGPPNQPPGPASPLPTQKPGLPESTSLTPMQFRVWLLSAMGVALDGFDFFIIGVALPFIQKDLSPAVWQIGAIGAAALGGVVTWIFQVETAGRSLREFEQCRNG